MTSRRTLRHDTRDGATTVELGPAWPWLWRIPGWGFAIFGVLGLVGGALDSSARDALFPSALAILIGLWAGEWWPQRVTFRLTETTLEFTRDFSLGRWRRTVARDEVVALRRAYRVPRQQTGGGSWWIEAELRDGRRLRGDAADASDALRAQQVLCGALGFAAPPPYIALELHGLQNVRPGAVLRW
ncbi:MAG: hypothetical protein SFW08_06070 [Gemmatimonadaceae bacterium]|nr:hypothetical protein [Gemmatimonadaceae bacterium]